VASAAARQIVDAGGAGLEVLRLDRDGWRDAAPISAGVVRVGVHAGPPPAAEGLEAFDILLTERLDAPRPWVGVADLAAEVARLRAAVEARPAAAAALAQVLRLSLKLGFDEALVVESLAFSTLLAGEAFAAWRAGRPVVPPADLEAPRVAVTHEGGELSIRMTRPAARNAVDAAMRDALCEALGIALLDPDPPAVGLSGAGAACSVGGDLDEFGQASDVANAHLIRTLRSPTRLIHALGGRATAVVQGAAVGSGVEMAAAAGRVVARPRTFFSLPELELGLIPGAGGTVSIPRRIGRRRTCWWALSGRRLDTATALAWGLVDAVERP